MADPRVDDILRALTGRDGTDAAARLAAWNSANGANTDNSLLDGYLGQQADIAALKAAPAPVADPHTHGFIGETAVSTVKGGTP